MKKQRNNRGFTLAEVLIVVVVVIVLAAVAFIGVIRHQKNLHQLEMDGLAKEIFVAAQNHLTMADSQGLLARQSGESDEDLNKRLGYPEDGSNGNIRYLVINSTSDLAELQAYGLMLPAGSVDMTVLGGGSFVIRYQMKPAVVLDVFYVTKEGTRFGGNLESTDAAALVAAYRGADNKSARQSYSNGIVGWYGGEEAAPLLPEPVNFNPPLLEVVNSDTLYAVVKPNNSGNNFNLRLVIHGVTSGNDCVYTIPVPNTNTASDSYTVTLDDVTQSGKGFRDFQELYRTGDSPLIPGEDLKITAVLEPKVIATPQRSDTKTDNSLFAYNAAGDGDVLIANIRHLENLEENVSGFNSSAAAVSARQLNDLRWSGFWGSSTQIYGNSTALTDPGCYYPVTPAYTLAYDGDEHKVSDLTVSFANDAGMFGVLQGGSVRDLELLDFSVACTNGGRSGALAGSVVGTRVTGVIAHHSSGSEARKITTGSGAAGGLIGYAEDCSIDQCAAALLVSSTSGNAGGLIGETKDAKISNSYSGGHTENGAYSSYNVTGATAGGLVGALTGDSELKNTYSTCSVSGTTAGGLAGISSAKVENSYCVGLVNGTTRGAFIGSNSGPVSGSYYFKYVNYNQTARLDMAPVFTNTGTYTLKAMDETAAEFNKFSNGLAETNPYDASLSGKPFTFKTIAQLSGDSSLGYDFLSKHYGDWPTPEAVFTNQK